MLAQEAALRHPNRIASLSLIATTAAFGGRDVSFKEKFLEARLAPLDAGKTMADIAPATMRHIVGPDASDAVVNAAATTMAAVPEITFRDILGCLVTFNRFTDIADIAQPCCLIAGECDASAQAPTMEKMAARLPNAEFHVMPGVGHLANLEAAGQCNTLINNFLTRVDSGERGTST